MYQKGDKVIALPSEKATKWLGGTVVAVFPKSWRVNFPTHKKPVLIPASQAHRIRPPKKRGSLVGTNKTRWPHGHEDFLRKNFTAFTNQQLAARMGVGYSVLRNELKRLGLKRYDVSKWPQAQSDFVVANFRTMSDQAIADQFITLFPRPRGWRSWHIQKRRWRLGLVRTPAETQACVEAHRPTLNARIAEAKRKEWRRVKMREAMGMSITFTKHRSKRRKSTEVKAINLRPGPAAL